MDILAALEVAYTKGREEWAKPPLGSPERPFDLVVPGWFEDLARERGEDLQEAADETFSVSVRVTVVRDYP